MESGKINTEILLRDLGGYGPFQVLVTTLVVFTCVSMTQPVLFMAFSVINPGWRCLDTTGHINHSANWTDTTTTIFTSTTSILTSTTTGLTTRRPGEDNGTSSDYVTDGCDGFETCERVQFNPEVSSLVTEWGLVCGKSWTPGVIVSVQMFGILLGALLSGHFGDVIMGRKLTVYSGVFLALLSNTLSIFSVSWQMFAALGFLVGVSVGAMSYLPVIYAVEFVPLHWRSRIVSLPVWSIGGILFVILTTLIKDWRTLQGVNSVILVMGMLPSIWLPRSIRWLIARGENHQCDQVLDKIAKWNKSSSYLEKYKKQMTDYKKCYHEEKHTSASYLIFELFRGKMRLYTAVLSYAFLTLNFGYYVTSFEVRSLPWSRYTNIFVVYAMDMLASAVASFVPNRLGRRSTSILSCVTMVLSLWSVAIIQLVARGDPLATGITLVVIGARFCQNIFLYVLVMYAIELYPTLARGTALGYFHLLSNLARAFTPLLVSPTPANVYVAYIILGTVVVFNSAFLLLLPETKGKPLPDIYNNTSKTYYHSKDDTGDDEILNSKKDIMLQSYLMQL